VAQDVSYVKVEEKKKCTKDKEERKENEGKRKL
jgi:hypothetical protein